MTHKWVFLSDDQECKDCGITMSTYLFTNRDCYPYSISEAVAKQKIDLDDIQTFDDVDWEKLSRELEEQMNKYSLNAKCTCGSESVGSNAHSTWCDKYGSQNNLQ